VAPQVMVQQPVLQPTPQPAAQRHYVAPPPVEALVLNQPAPVQAAPVQPAPVLTAPSQPAAQPAAVQPRRTPNLFSRVTGNAASWAKQAVSEPSAPPVTPQMRATAPARPVPQPAAPVLQAPPAPMPQPVAQPAPQPMPQAAAPQTAAAPAQPVVQPRLSGLDPKDRLSANRAEEDLLDIPAFLRRQAN
jgi:cell division protein FtsZ